MPTLILIVVIKWYFSTRKIMGQWGLNTSQTIFLIKSIHRKFVLTSNTISKENYRVVSLHCQSYEFENTDNKTYNFCSVKDFFKVWI